MKDLKKLGAAVLAMTFVFSAFGCSKKDDDSKKKKDKSSDETADTKKDDDEDKETKNAGGGAGSEAGALVPGKLYFINTDDPSCQVMSKLSLAGNRAGSTGYNSKEASTEGIRCIFELNEYVEFYPEATENTGIIVFVLEHRDDQDYYLTTQFGEEMPGFVTISALCHDEEDGDDVPWDSFYLNPEEWHEGYYDFVFTYNGKAFATLLTYFYGSGALEEKSDADLDRLVSGL
ncbi:MAG: hypothetical protein J6Y08_07315 [Clostridiales bacterium]|nr:hypothetical protein [Clostridiales bacterium]